tara:strand:- start:3508 stop:4413 length:906 start_codon:yes stop_codon:yes gene_type:complete
MSNITYASLLSSGGRISAVLSALVQEKLHDPTDLRAVMTQVPWASMGSDTMDVTLDAVPGAYATAAEAASTSGSAYGTGKFQLQAVKKTRVYSLTDLFGVTGGPIDMERVVSNLVAGVGLTMTDLLTALFPAISNNVGGSGVDLTVANIYSAQFQLNLSSAQGPYSCVLHPQQMNDFRTSLRAETSALQYVPATAEALATRGPGFQGTWNGIDFWQSDSVELVNTSADRNGAMFSSSAFAYTMAPARSALVPQESVLVDAGELLVEIQRDATAGLTHAVANIFTAVAESQDLAACGIISDA